MRDPNNIDWEREGCLGCKQRGSCGTTYRLDNGDPVDALDHHDLEHARAEIHLEHHPDLAHYFAWEERMMDEHPGRYLALMALYAVIIFAFIIGLAVIA